LRGPATPFIEPPFDGLEAHNHPPRFVLAPRRMGLANTYTSAGTGYANPDAVTQIANGPR